MKIMHIVGARPNFMKAAAVMRAMAACGRKFRQTLVHTGQHYDREMSSRFFGELRLPKPDFCLEVGSGSHAVQTARVMERLEPVVLRVRPDWVFVYGDVNSTMASAVVCAKMGVRVAHVEAGLRSFDRTMPEETNRIITDHVCDLLFTPSADADLNLRREGLPAGRIRRVGNVMIDTLVRLLPDAERRWRQWDGEYGGKKYVLVTLHRPSNVDDPRVLRKIVQALKDVAGKAMVVFPVHPRTRARLRGMGFRADGRGQTGVRCLPPLGYLDFLALEQHAAVVVTDSGGVQEETTFLGVPCITLRPNTERPVTISHGTNRLVNDPARLSNEVSRMMGEKRRKCRMALWDGNSGTRISRIMLANA